MLAQMPGGLPSADSSQRLGCSSIRQEEPMSPLRPPERSVRKAKEKKGTFWGTEVTEALHWHGWELGKEFTKHLSLKNVHVKTQKLSYRPPATRFFITVFPQPIVLSPGMSLTLPIIFRPLEKKEYEDSICFEKPEGEFSVALRATLPRHKLLFPEAIQLPLCAVHDFSEASFPLCNVGDLITLFNWETPSPFHLTPVSGMLEPGSECVMKVTVQPQMALVYDALAVCWFGDNEEQKRTIKLRAIAKYPHLLVSVLGELGEDVEPGDFQDVLCFGSVAVGATVERHVEICNPSMVSVPFRIERAKEPLLRDYVFSCDVSQAIVPANGKLLISVRFSPQTVGVQSVDYFTLEPVGNLTQTVLKVIGSCKGPLVSLQHSLVNFGWLSLGESVTQPLEISNVSDVPAYYQFDIDGGESVFSFDRPCGVLSGMATIILRVTFRPTHPIVCYRRVVCLVHHQNPLFLDLFGTCHSDTTKPAILRPRHLLWYRTNMARGLTFYPPDILSSMLREGKLQMDENRALKLPPQVPEDKPPEEYPYIDPMTEYFHDGITSDLTIFPPHVSVSVREFDFGCCVRLQEVEPLPLCLTNHTKGKITVAWICRPESPFRVTPETCDIPPLKSTAFRLVFQPSQRNTLYAAELEGFAFYKVLRHYSNIEEDSTMCPSWCLTIRLRGHTFEADRQHFIPHYVLDSPKVFPAVGPNTNTYRSVLLWNVGTSPITFCMNQDTCPSVLVKPCSGYVAPGAHQIFLLSTQPADMATHQHILSLQLNSYPKYTQEISLRSSGESLLLLLEGDGNLYFKPTCVGTSTTRTYTIKNCTRLPMQFKWKIQESDRKVLSVKPATGVIQPNEALAQAWTFTPGEETKYLLRSWVSVWRAQGSSGPESPESTRYTLRVIGEGALGTIRAQEEQRDLGNILVGSLQSCDLVLLNNGTCSLNYILHVEQIITGPCDPEEVLSDPLALQLDHYKGMIPARSKAIVQATVSPARQLHYTWSISYTISTPKALDPANAVGEQQALCCVVATGVYPSVCVTDVCAAGSARGISKLHLWRLFALETLNQYLERDPTSAELTYRVPTRHSVCPVPPVHTPVLLDFNFGAAPIEAEPSVVILMLENNGVVPVEWAFLFPSDQKIDVEHWAENTEFNPSELHQMRVQDNQLFSVSPKSGRLFPGQEQTVLLSHRHDFIGTDRLPVLLKVSHGREILLNFIGVTVEREQRYVHFTSTKHVFTPIAIGSSSPPKQIYELYNGGSMAVAYEIQLDSVMKIQEENFQHPVFVCLNPRGETLPGMTSHIEWVFSPLEARTYSVDVPIHILEGDSALITFQGIGYDPHIMGETAQFNQVLSPSVTPGSSKLTVPGQTAFLSQHRICLGNIPVYSKSSRLVFLNNASESEAVIFAWHVGTSNASEMLQIVPEMGVVQPGESTHCIITLQASGNACFYNVDLVCEVVMQQPLAKYEKALQEWEAEKQRQTVEFTITEQDLGAETNLKQHARSSADSSAEEKLTKSPAVTRQCKTLPPIKNLLAPNPPVSRSQRRHLMDKEASRLWAKPEPPKSHLLHLGVTARSHSMDDFLSNFCSELPKFFLCRHLQQTAGDKAVDKRKDEGGVRTDPVLLVLAGSSEQEMQVVTDLLTAVIRGLLEDTQFHQAVSRSLAEPMPYFHQFWTAESAKHQGRKRSPGGSSRASPSPAPCAKDKPGEEEERQEECEMSLVTSPRAAGEEPPDSLRDILHQEQLREEKETITRLPAFGNLLELVLENTLQNIMVEASRGEVVLTARPRVIALPPSSAQRGISPATPGHPASLLRTAGPGPSLLTEGKETKGYPQIVLST
ncbi:cilia- and flagella-associated protein 65 isoform X1 [Malaclemys terrapin pileata]|uniref:cilia- and flagella-associated protein 65 isoform X1 n=1 Tax=Malaclemys terrapin pileata TaxID=2991368 RepID=UPI0023A7DB1E|nr:cilia- and flagella-associated protein 65 isoform X1 [Malaclemys terrapin pileata]